MTPDNIIAMSLYGPDDIEDKRPDMIQGGYSAGSTIASQLGRFRPGARAVRLSHDADQPLQLLVEHALGLRHRARLERQLLQRRSPATWGCRTSCRRPSPPLRASRCASSSPGRRAGSAASSPSRSRGSGAEVVAADVDEGGLEATVDRDRARGRRGASPCAATSRARPTPRAPWPRRRSTHSAASTGSSTTPASSPSRARRRARSPPDEWDRVMDVNAKGTWLMSRAAIPALTAAGGGCDRQPGERDRVHGLARHEPLRREQGRRHRPHARARARARPGRRSASTPSRRATRTPRAAARSVTRPPTT